MDNLKKIIKDLKRVRWISIKEANKNFLIVFMFILITSLILLGVATSFTILWSKLGVGINV